jgi:hypothetical protein
MDLLIAGCVLAIAVADGPATRVRSTNGEMLKLIAEGRDKSPTFNNVVDAIDRSNGIVYVEFGYCAFGHLNGCLLPFVGAVGSERYLRVIVSPDRNQRSHDQLLAVIAHELRHAKEVLDHPEVVDVATLEAMFRKIGVPARSVSGYETEAARAAGDAVLRELSRPAAVARQPREYVISRARPVF